MHDTGERTVREELFKPFAVSYIALNKGGPVGDHGRPRVAQVVVHHYRVPALQQEIGNRTANVARTACYENIHEFTCPSCTLSAEPKWPSRNGIKKSPVQIKLVVVMGGR